MSLSETTSQAAASFGSLPIAKQVGVLGGLAVSIALAISVVLWSKEPVYRPLFSQLTPKDSNQVIEVLARNGIPYKLDEKSGSVLVVNSDVHQARLKLAEEGLPRGSGRGYEIFSNPSSFGSSQFMENARMKYALETELSRTVSQFSNIKAARVHLAIPKQSAFVRAEKKPSASVFLDVYSGISLPKSTIASIINLVASSVPGLNSDNVTLVDQEGQLLNDGGSSNIFSITDKYFDYQQQVESTYAQKIKEILTPIYGVGKIKVKVSANIDFTASEQTREIYNPDLQALRSEQTLKVTRALNEDGGGVAGATSNNAQAASQNFSTGVSTGENSGSSQRLQSTKNYEVDKTVSYSKEHPGRIRRLTVAILIAIRTKTDPDTGKTVEVTLNDKEKNEVKALAVDAIGIDYRRGDSVNVLNASFAEPKKIEALPEIPIWQQDWFWLIVKQGLAGVFVLLLVFGVIRPMFRSLAMQSKTEDQLRAALEQKEKDLEKRANEGPQASLPEKEMEQVQNLASSDPKGVAQVVKTWVDGGG